MSADRTSPEPSARNALQTQWRERTPSTFLYAPANDARKASRLDQFGADAVILDLEDSVPLDQKSDARTQARLRLSQMAASTLRCVRVNHLSTGLTEPDIDEALCAQLDCLIYPKAQSSDELWQVDRILGEAEGRMGLTPGHVVLIPLVETARGLSSIEDILAKVPDRLLTVGFGIADYCLDMGIDLANDSVALDYPRARLGVASRAAGLARPIDGPWLRIADTVGLVGDSRRSRDFGFGGRQLIHPTHVTPVAYEYLGISQDRVDQSQRVVESFERSLRDGTAALQVDGELVDYPMYHRAQRVLDAVQTHLSRGERSG